MLSFADCGGERHMGLQRTVVNGNAQNVRGGRRSGRRGTGRGRRRGGIRGVGRGPNLLHEKGQTGNLNILDYVVERVRGRRAGLGRRGEGGGSGG